jgi:hypothetical protein
LQAETTAAITIFSLSALALVNLMLVALVIWVSFYLCIGVELMRIGEDIVLLQGKVPLLVAQATILHCSRVQPIWQASVYLLRVEMTCGGRSSLHEEVDYM